MVTSEQLTADRRDRAIARSPWAAPDRTAQDPWAVPGVAAERAARTALKAQVAKLERELSVIVAAGFPHISSGPRLRTRRDGGASAAGVSAGAPRGEDPRGPHLLTLAELERLRDALAARVREAQALTRERDESERRARELLERMKAEPSHYKFVRLPVVELGERGCGAWHVRPRLGLLGMLAGWWQLKLSSGCPLAGGPRVRAAPLPAPP